MSLPRLPSLRRLTTRRQALVVLASTVVSCRHLGGIKPLARSPSVLKDPLVVLIAIDGVRWQDVFGSSDGSPRTENTLPELRAMEKQGAVLGAPGSQGFYATGPNFVSLPGYMEMLSGTSALGCTENDCLGMQTPTLLEDFQLYSPGNRPPSAVFSSWEKIEIAAGETRVGLASTGRFSGFNEEVLNGYPTCRMHLNKGRAEGGGHGSFRHDRITSALALSYLQEAAPPFLFVSLGETDEAAHKGDRVGYERALQAADRFVGTVRRSLAQERLRGRSTLLLVTSDHGRAENFRDHGRRHPESSQSFLFVEGSGVRAVGRNCRKRGQLRDIAPTVRALCGLPPGATKGQGRVLREIMI